MNAQLQGAPDAKPRRAVLKLRSKRNVDHAEIVRMAAAEAASRAAERREKVATAAYFRAQRRGFEPGHELEDWLAAEIEIAQAPPLEKF